MTEDDKKLWKLFCDNLKDDIVYSSFEIRYNSKILDLHGYTIQTAFSITKDFIETTSYKEVIIITGKSGQIKREFLRWLEHFKKVKSYYQLNDGSYKIFVDTNMIS